jgi:hypothetical protein
MATRLYSGNVAAVISPAYDAGWEVTSVAVRRKATLLTSEYSSGSTVLPASAGTGVAGQDALSAQLVYGPLARQMIGGTIKGQNLAREASGLSDARAQVLVKLVSADGSVTRGTLLAMDTGALANEFPTSTGTRTNRQFPRGGAVTLTQVLAQSGDYLVIEYGHRNEGTNTSAIAIRGSDTAGATTDLPEDETTTAGDTGIYRHWFELSQTLILSHPGGVQPVVFDVGVGVL